LIVARESGIQPSDVVRGDEKNGQLDLISHLLGRKRVASQSSEARLVDGNLLLVCDENVH
jgi:hypothetical protein